MTSRMFIAPWVISCSLPMWGTLRALKEDCSMPHPIILRLRRLRLVRLVCVTSLLWTVCGCSQTGPRTVTVGRPLYNVAVQRTNNEQLLLNLVRLKYRDTPFFLAVASVSTNFEFEAEANAGMILPEGGLSIYNFGLGGRVQDRGENER